MEAVCNSNERVVSLVSKIVAQLSRNERAQADEAAAVQQSAASIKERRRKLYESLLSSQKFEQCTDLNCALGNNIEKCVQNMYITLEKQQTDQKQKQELPKSVGLRRRNNMMLAKPLRLQSSPCFEEQFPQYAADTAPKILRSIENMRDAMKPIVFNPISNVYLKDINAMRNVHRNQIKSSLKSSILKDSMARMNESKRGTRRVKINLPLRDKDEPASSESVAEEDPTTDVTLEKHFVSDLLLSNELKWHQDKTMKLTFIKLPLLIEHLKQAAGMQK